MTKKETGDRRPGRKGAWERESGGAVFALRQEQARVHCQGMPVELPIDRMTLEEKLRAMEVLWDDLCRRDENIPVPQWHKDLLDERERLVKEGKAQFLDWETALHRISERTA